MITEKSIRQMMVVMQDLPLNEGESRVCCLGCGKNIIVDAGHDEAAYIRMKNHALAHEQELSEELSSHPDWLGKLVGTVTFALPKEDWQN